LAVQFRAQAWAKNFVKRGQDFKNVHHLKKPAAGCSWHTIHGLPHGAGDNKLPIQGAGGPYVSQPTLISRLGQKGQSQTRIPRLPGHWLRGKNVFGLTQGIFGVRGATCSFQCAGFQFFRTLGQAGGATLYAVGGQGNFQENSYPITAHSWRGGLLAPSPNGAGPGLKGGNRGRGGGGGNSKLSKKRRGKTGAVPNPKLPFRECKSGGRGYGLLAIGFPTVWP